MCLAVSHVKETEATARPIWTGLKKEFMKSTRFHEKPLARNGNPYVLFCYVFVVVVVFSLTLTNANAKHYKLVCCAVVDPGIPMDSAGLIDCQFPTWPRFQKIVCRNERIRMLGEHINGTPVSANTVNNNLRIHAIQIAPYVSCSESFLL